ncbi:hypothetical protein MWG58_32190 [Streptomyces sp. WAC00276]|uniref:hypothetical protein n=1 Tax=Streptomyces sp. WAC00276 TaxID=2933778 RepID=UPI0020005665|nr:hypothetical protein [Streptomyces sp. WAC00276]MCK2145473.1 hypothetical protein [Streptomyces sp. WAC00276]
MRRPALARPYRPAPAPPSPDTEGRFRIGSQLYRTASLPAYLRRVEWLARDPATHREAVWLALNPAVAAATVLLPAALVVAGLALTAAGPDLLATASGPLLAVAGAACGPALLTAYGRWTRALLGPRTAPARTGRAEALWRGRCGTAGRCFGCGRRPCWRWWRRCWRPGRCSAWCRGRGGRSPGTCG